MVSDKIKVCAGQNGLLEAANHKADWVMSAMVGSAGLLPGLAAISSGANLALANKKRVWLLLAQS